MQRVSDPRHISSVFRALGVPLEEQKTTGEQINAVRVIQVTGGPASSRRDRWTITCSDLAPRLLSRLTDRQVRELSQDWFHIGSEASRLDPSWKESFAKESAKRLNEFKSSMLGNSDVDEEWKSAFKRFLSEWDGLWTSNDLQPELGSKHDAFASAVSSYLDTRLLKTLRDASPWRSEETTCFWRLLSKAGDSRDDGAQPSLIGTQQLESEIDVLRGKMIRFQGGVRSVEYVDRANELLGITGYWVVWLRGRDEAIQPIGIYSTNDEWAKYENAIGEDDFPLVEVLAAPGKKLAYASQAGVEIAPTMFASGFQAIEEERPTIGATTGDSFADDLWFALSVGGLVAGMVLIPVWLNWRKAPLVRRERFRVGGKKPASQAAESGREAGGKLLWLPFLLVTTCSSQAQAIPQDDPLPSVPWAGAQDPSKLKLGMLRDRLEPLYSSASMEEITQYIGGTDTGFPDDLLKSIRSLDQLRWPDLPADLNIQLADESAKAKAVELEGYIRMAMPVRLTPSQEIWFQSSNIQSVFRLQIEVDDDAQGPKLVTVFAKRVPQAWLEAAKLRQPARIKGLALESHEELLCVLCDAPRWVIGKDQSFEELNPKLKKEWHLLAKSGWNLAWIDTIQANSQKALQKEESEPLLSLMKYVSENSSAGDIVAPLEALAEPEDSFVKTVKWRVRLVSASVVDLDTEADKAVLGQDYYVQFDGFVDIGSQKIRYKVGEDFVPFEREFPITILMRSGSPFISQARIDKNQKSWEVGQYAEVEGCFYRLWSYRSEMMKQKGERARQAAPLVIASSLEPALPAVARSSAGEIGWFGYALCFATLVILAAVLFYASKDTRRSARGR